MRRCIFTLCTINIVTGMESRFPAMFILWLGREFYRDEYGMTGSIQAWTPDLGDKFGDEIWDLKRTGIFSMSLLGEEISLNVLDDSIDVTGFRGSLYKECAWITE
ncbi:hypothetical protein AVEN_69181-1 [Araneus ventricosus]|uniref:Uncharacterized protein n=1 Tax=Araneus ventricosus TaxID=182803 RepID=A0A4Y2MRG4_ARAVE|nr:hypothetical protein AVEN_69181-1 [Araneus ventricosus]